MNKTKLKEKLKYESANFIRRLLAVTIDYLIIIVIWYVFVKKDVDALNAMFSTLDPDMEGALDLLIHHVTTVWTTFILSWFVISNVIFIFPPAIIGKGKTIGKLITGLSMVDKETLKEINPLRLIFRETVGRMIIEQILIVPFIISFFMALIRYDSKTLHDLITSTVVVKTSDLLED